MHKFKWGNKKESSHCYNVWIRKAPLTVRTDSVPAWSTNKMDTESDFGVCFAEVITWRDNNFSQGWEIKQDLCWRVTSSVTLSLSIHVHVCRAAAGRRWDSSRRRNILHAVQTLRGQTEGRRDGRTEGQRNESSERLQSNNQQSTGCLSSWMNEFV